MSSLPPLHLALALDGAGWHPAAWREPDARPDALLTAGYWADLGREADRAVVDLVTVEDGLALQSDRYGAPDGRTDRVRGRLDAVPIAARVAPLTGGLGWVPSVTVTHTEPFHISKAIATLDYVSGGRAGVRVQVSGRAQENAHFGRRQLGLPADLDFRSRPDPAVVSILSDLMDEAADYVEVVRRLWDSWEDDAEIRDVATGRFIDRDKLHYIDFQGRWFSVKGPSITPRPPQGQPLVAALAHGPAAYRLVGRSTDLAFVTPSDAGEAARVVEDIQAARHAAGRDSEPIHVLADLVVFLDDTEAAAEARKERLDEVAGETFSSDAHTFVGTPIQLADLLQEWHAAGLSGFRLRPATIPHDLHAVTRELIPILQRRASFPQTYGHRSLRERFGLPRPANRYAA